MASHTACIVHLVQNIIAIRKTEQLGELVSATARTYRIEDFKKLFKEVREKDYRCADYLTRIGFEHWISLHFVRERCEAAKRDENTIPPKFQEILIANFRKGADYFILKIAEGRYKVHDRKNNGFEVNLY
ncbi:hypothetical protein V5N11_032870 [Cardamine amara subsp. amara]|uniref:Transposase n=1 Tax=Cardamine amara subsp. amara TaxID=228776 RepID=A0ABD1BHM9_CARAN